MREKLLNIIIFACIAIQALAQSGQESYSDVQAHNFIWEDKLYRQVEFLADSLCDGRATGTPGSTEAAFWIIRRFRQLGLMPFDGNMAVGFTDPNGRNIIGMLPGSNRSHSDSYVIVCSHYDGLGRLEGTLYPGADSNASGVVAMISLAEMFSGMKLVGSSFGRNLIFVALDAKGNSMRGSRALWEILSEGKFKDPVSGKAVTPDKISMVVNIDQIGGVDGLMRSGRQDFLVMLGKEKVGREYSDMLGICNLKYGTLMDLSFDYFGSKSFTNVFYNKVCDQRVFVEHKIPAVLFTSGITMKTNKPYDTADSLNMSVLKRRICLMYHWIEYVLRRG